MKNIFLILFYFWAEVSVAQELKLCQKINEPFDYFDLQYDGYDIKKSIDGNLMLLALNKEKSPILIKIDTVGNLIFKKKLTKKFHAKVLTNTLDSGFLIAGFKYPKNTKYRDARKLLCNGLITKFDKNGNFLWEKEIEGFQSCKFKAIDATNDGNFILIAEVAPILKKKRLNSYPCINIGIYKVNTEGKILEQDFYGGDYWDSFKSMEKLNDGSFELLLSLRTKEKRIETNHWQLKLNSNGTFQYQNVENFDNQKDISSFHTLSTQYKVAIGSNTNRFYNIYRDSCFYKGLIKIEYLSENIEKSFCNEVFQSITSQDDNIYIVGNLMEKLGGLSYPWKVNHIGIIKKLDNKGNVIWDKKISDTEMENIKVKKIIPISKKHFWVVAMAGNSIFDESIYIYKLED